MTLDERLLACESMLTRLDAVMASAEDEVRHSDALEEHLRRLLDTLDGEKPDGIGV